jgi:hypothetical protein
MPADAGIYSQIRPFTMEDPLTQAGRAMAVKNAQLQNQEAERKFTLEDDLSSALAAFGRRSRQGVAGSRRARPRDGGAAAAGQGRHAEGKADVERKLKIWEQAGAWSIGLDQAYRRRCRRAAATRRRRSPRSEPIWQQTRAQAKELGLNLPEQFDPQKNFAGIATAKNHVEYFKSLAPTVHMTDTGGTVTAVNTNPLAGPVGPVAGATPSRRPARPPSSRAS